MFNVEHTFSTIVHPQSQGYVEKFQSTLKRGLKSLVNRYPNNWDESLPLILWSYRSSPVEGLTYSPFTLLFGREQATAVLLLHDGWISKSMLKPTKKHVLNYTVDLRDKLDNVHDITQRETQIARNKSKHIMTDWHQTENLK